jgi:tight adherence protein B
VIGLAALLTALTTYLAIAAAMGRMPRFGRVRTERAQVSDRQTWLLQAGVDLTPRQFVAGSVAVGIVVFFVLTGLTATPAAAAVPAATAGLAPRLVFARRRARRLRELQEAWPDGIRDLLASIAAGRSLNQAVTDLATNGPEPLRVAFHRYPTLARVLGVVPALEMVKEELADPTSDRVLEVLILAHQRGGHLLADILRDLAEATTQDVRTLEGIVTDGLEQRINARAVFVLPWLLLLMLTVQDGTFRGFYRSPAGLLVVVLGAILSLVGLAVVNRLAREPVEQRVLGGAAPASVRDGEAPA